MYPSHASNLFRTLTQNVCLSLTLLRQATWRLHLGQGHCPKALCADWTLSYIFVCHSSMSSKEEKGLRKA